MRVWRAGWVRLVCSRLALWLGTLPCSAVASAVPGCGSCGTVGLSCPLGPGGVVRWVRILRPGDVDGDVQLLLDMPMPYTARALTEVTYLYLSAPAFDALVQQKPTIARRWMSSIALRLATSQARILGLLGRSLTEQVARLLLDEAAEGKVTLTQRRADRHQLRHHHHPRREQASKRAG